MSKRLDFLLSFPEIKDSGELFNLYRGFVHCLSNSEAFALLINDKTTGLRAEALVKKIVNEVKNNIKKNSELFKESLIIIEKLKWPQKQKVAKVLFGMSSYITTSEKLKLTRYFLHSRYNSFRYYGYNIIEKDNLGPNFKTELLGVWLKYPDVWILELLVNILKPKELFSIYEVAEEVLADAEFDFEVLKLKNRYYSKIIDFIPDRLSKLLAEDSISYVFIMKNANKQIDKDLALKIYKRNRSSRSLASCYGDLGQWGVLMDIYNSMAKKLKGQLEKAKS